MPYDLLMREGRIGSMPMRHRIISGPMEKSLANRDGSMTARYIDYLTERAKGGAALMQVESTYVDTRGMGHLYQVGVHGDHVIPGLRRVADAVHAHGAKIGLEIYFGGRETPSYMSQRQPIAPSPMMCKVLEPPPTPREMTQQDINDVTAAFARAAERTIRGGFDMVIMHGAHGYLLCGFLSPFSNKRTDKYGGSPENRARFPLEVLAEIRKTVGTKVPIGYRMTADEFVDGGLKIGDTAEFSKRLADAGIDLIDISGGIYESFQLIMQGPDAPKGGFVNNAVQIKKAVGNAVQVSVAQRLNDPEFANEAMRREGLDFITVSRGFHADPHFARKVREDRKGDIVPCIGCNHCVNLLEANRAAGCAVNPHTTYETTRRIRPVARPRQVMIVGGGPAGMHAARILARQGNRVSLFEASSELGGQLRYSGRVAPEHLEFVQYLARQMKKLEVEVQLNTKVDLKLIDSVNPDAVVIAAGASGGLSFWPVVGNVTTFDLFSAMDRPADRWKGKAVILGGEGESCVLAIHLARQGVDVTVIEPKREFGDNREQPVRELLMIQLRKYPAIHLLGETTAEEIGPGYVVTQSHGKFDRIENVGGVVIGGRVSNNALYEQLRAVPVEQQREVYNIGDSLAPRDLFTASAEAAEVAELIRLCAAGARAQ